MILIDDNGLIEGIRCALCTNPMANDRGCDGGCVINEYQLKKVLDVIDKVQIKNPTNGDMIKAMFPNAKMWEVTRDDVHCAYIEFKDICEIKSFPLSWWNAEYEKEQI